MPPLTLAPWLSSTGPAPARTGIRNSNVGRWSYGQPQDFQLSAHQRSKWSAGAEMGLRLQSQRPHDIVSIAEKLKAGSVAIRVGFWLDNEVVVFSGEKPADQKQIEMFECWR